MPVKSKYKEVESYFNYIESLMAIQSFYEDIGDKKNAKKVNDFNAKLSMPVEVRDRKGNRKLTHSFKMIENLAPGLSDSKLEIKFVVPEVEKEAIEIIKAAHRDIGNHLADHDKKYEPFQGWFKFTYALTDYDAGFLPEALADNIYLARFKSMCANGLNVKQFGGYEEYVKNLGGEEDPETHKKIPLAYMNDFFSYAADVLILERKLQRYKTEDPSEEKEARYLSELIKTYDKMTGNYDKFYEFGLKHIDKESGKSEYDKYTNSPMDLFFGISLNGHADAARNPRIGIEWLKGKSQAAKNGWGLKYLDAAASIYGLAHDVETEAALFEKKFPLLEPIKEKLRLANKKIAEENKKLKELQEQLKQENDPEKKKDLEDEIETRKVQLETTYMSSKNRLEGMVRDYDKIKAGFKRLIKETDELKQEIATKGVHSASDQYQLIRKLKDFYDDFKPEKYDLTYADSSIGATFDKCSKVLDAAYPDLEKERAEALKAGRKKQRPTGAIQNGNEDSLKVLENYIDVAENPKQRMVKSYKLSDTDKTFKPYCDALRKAADVMSGDMTEACNSNFVLNGLVSAFSSGPAIFRKADAYNYVPHDKIREWMDNNGVTGPLMSFFSGMNDLIQAEYDRQRDEKTGWNSAKERRYYENLTRAYEKLLSSYDELCALPDEVHNENDYLDDALGYITGKGGNYKDIGEYMSAMKWEMQAMKNGWKKEDLAVLGSVGRFEGIMNEEIRQHDFTINEAMKNKALAEKEGRSTAEYDLIIDNYTRFKEEYRNEYLKNIEEFKDKVWDRKITGPADVIETINQIERTVEKPTDDFKSYYEEVSAHAFDELDSARPDAAKGYFRGKSAPRANTEDASEFMLNGIMNMEKLDRNTALHLTAEYIKNAYYQSAAYRSHPEYADRNRAEYSMVTAALEKECLKYAANFLDAVKAGAVEGVAEYNGKLLADQLSCSFVENNCGEIQDKIEARIRREKLDSFLSNDTGENVKKGLDALEKGDTGFWSTSSKYRDLVNNYRNLYESKQEIDRSIEHRRNVIESDKEKFYTSGIGAAQQDYRLLMKKCLFMEKAISSYIRGKEKKTAEGGTLKTSEQTHYEAMKEAHSSVVALMKNLRSFGNKGPSVFDKDLIEGGYYVDASYINKTVKAQKESKQAEGMKLKALSDDISAREYETRKQLMGQPEANREALLASAEKELFLSVVKNNLMKPGENLVSETRKVELANKALAKFPACEEFEHFKKSFIDNPKFKEEFEKNVLEGAKNGKLSHEDIVRYHDNAVKAASPEAAKNAADGKTENKNAGAGAKSSGKKAL